MQILASALPGFRDLRAPLTAGYLWLILLWIWLKPNLAARPTNDAAAAMYDLGKAVGPIWIGVGVSVAAYLIGSVSQAILRTPNSLSSYIADLVEMGERPTGFYLEQDSKPTPPSTFDAIHRLSDRAKHKLQQNPPPKTALVSVDHIDRIASQIDRRVDAAKSALERELKLPATLLIGKEPELFTEADRLKSEGDLRLAIAPPFLAIAIYISSTQSWWWIASVIPILVLWIQGYRRDAEYKFVMTSAFQQGLARSQAIEELEKWVDNFSPKDMTDI